MTTDTNKPADRHAEGVLAGMPEAPAPPADEHAEEHFSEARAAKTCGVARSTIQHARKTGKFPHVYRNDKGWSIPLSDLIAAGFTPEKTGENPVSTPLPNRHPEGVLSGMPEAPAAPADEHAEEITLLRQQLQAAEREKAALEQRSAVAEAQLQAARERGDEHLKRAEQAEARLDQMLANQTAMALTLKDQQHLIGERLNQTPPEEPVPKPETVVEDVQATPPPPTPEPLGRRMRKWFGN